MVTGRCEDCAVMCYNEDDDMRNEDVFDRVVSVWWLGWFRATYYKYREMWLYALMGLGTVLINLFVYSLFTESIDLGVLLANAIAWVGATLFAFVSNRRWVFTFHTTGFYALMVQLGGFCAGRLITLGIEELMLYVCIEICHLPNMLIKFFAQIIVIALNYFFSKLVVFRKPKNDLDDLADI